MREIINFLILFVNIINTMAESLLKTSDPVKVMKASRAMCEKFEQTPNFDEKFIIGVPWRIYHSWNQKINPCIDLTFKKATPGMIRKFQEDMSEYLEENPEWDQGSLVMGTVQRDVENLLFKIRTPGSYIAVANANKIPGYTPTKHNFPLMQFRFKLIENGRYLLFMECQTGTVSLSARLDGQPYRKDVERVAKEYDFGDSFPACTWKSRI